MDHSVCRLCSSDRNLISLFKGKNRTTRDYIRKLVALAVGIEYEANDYFDCICCTCALQTFNMYVFRSKSLKNQEKLQMFAPTCKKKQKSTKIANIVLPEYAELKSIISPWLITKQFLSASESSESSASTITSNKDSLSPNIILVDGYTQTDQPPKSFNVSLLTKIEPIVCHEYVQCELLKSKCEKKDNHSSKNEYVQCELLKPKCEDKDKLSKNKYVQCDLSQSKSSRNISKQIESIKKDVNKSTVSNNKNKHSNNVHQRSRSIVKAKDKHKNNLKRHESYIIPKTSVPISTLTKSASLNDSIIITNGEKKSQQNSPLVNDLSIRESSKDQESLNKESFANEMQLNKLLVKEKEIHRTDDFLNNSQLIVSQVDNILQDKESSNQLEINETPHLRKRLRFSKDLIVKSLENSTIEDSNEIDDTVYVRDSSIELNCTPIQERLRKPLSIECSKILSSDIKIEPHSPLSSALNLETSLVIKSSPCFYENNFDPSSPCSSGLLQVTGKVQYLRSCVECAAIIYTKAELVEHRKSHMKCCLCKKKFPSIKKTKEHMNSDCIRKLCSKNLLVHIPKLENCQDFEVKHK